MNEPQISEKPGFPSDVPVDGDGTPTTFAEARNVYALLEAKATRDAELTAAPNRRTFNLTRAGFTGIQKYSAVWTGDALSRWDYLANTPQMLQGMGVSGIPFVGSDVGGFTGSPGGELYARWFEVGSFSPFFRTHSTTGSPDQEPWAFGPEIQDVAQRMLAVRYTLLPYWYECFVQASESGLPVMRPLWFDDPADVESQKHVDEWWIGDALLVAPVVADKVTQRDVYLPAGVFHDFYTGAAFTGPTTVTLPAPLGRVPILVRGGSVLPAIDREGYAGEHPDVPRHLDVYPGGAGTSTRTTLHEDDGESLDYLHGAASTIAVDLDVTKAGLTLAIGPRTGGYTPPVARSYDVRIHGVGKPPSSVTIDGATTKSTWSEDTRTLVGPVADYAKAQTLAIAYPTALAARRTVDVAFRVAVPASTPAGSAIYVASSTHAWNAKGTTLTTTGEIATGTLSVPEGTLVRYQVTRGDWTQKEGDAHCAQLPANRTLEARYGTSGAMPVTISVGGWIDRCP
jgi:alpha-glucosidase